MRNFKLVILGETWDVKFLNEVFDPENGNPVCGTCLFHSKTIEVNKTLEKRLLHITLLHEMFHAYVRRSGIYNGMLSHDMEEIIADQFSTVICENFDFSL